MKPPCLELGLDEPLQVFPGEIAGASLKPEPRQRDGAGRGGFPRRNRRGLIEARPRRRRGAGSWGGFPRRNRRGLIEAPAAGRASPRPARRFPRRNRRGLIEARTRGWRRFRWWRVVFPGEIAGASLKRHLPLGERRQLHGFPRRNRRGLIEARAGARVACRPGSGRFPRRNRRGLIEASDQPGGWRSRRIVFPGEIAGASLKRGDRARAGRRDLRVFPGEIAGASLKREPAGQGLQRVLGGFPRRNRRGLIEAANWVRTSVASPILFSPAKSPGPH